MIDYQALEAQLLALEQERDDFMQEWQERKRELLLLQAALLKTKLLAVEKLLAGLPVKPPDYLFEETFDAPLSAEKWTSGQTPWGTDRNAGAKGTLQRYSPEMVRVENGVGIFQVEKLTTPDVREDARIGYQSYMLHTHSTFEFLYGRVEFRCKAPATIGARAAVWLLPARKDFRWDFEIDFEWFGTEAPEQPGAWNRDRLRCTVHYRDPDTKDKDGKPLMKNIGQAVEDPIYDFGDWHTYVIDWQPDFVRFYIEDKMVFEVTDPKVIPHDPAYLLVNCDVGGASGDPALGAFPVQAVFDYIRVRKNPAQG